LKELSALCEDDVEPVMFRPVLRALKYHLCTAALL